MDNVKFIELETLGGLETHAIIEHADGSYTAMSKAEYDRQQAEQSTPIVIDEAETI
jgi:hypothetical protein